MAYADLNAVLGRAGRLSPAWGDDTNPSTADVEGFLVDVSAEIDALIAARGFSVPVKGAAADALRGLAADGALVLAIEATWPADEGRGAAKALLESARSRWAAGMAALRDGRHPAVATLEASESAPASSNFWSNEPTYPTADGARRDAQYPSLAPGAARAMKF